MLLLCNPSSSPTSEQDIVCRTWLFGERWPVYWNEAIVVQTFLAFNTAFEALLSVPLIRHHDEAFLVDRYAERYQRVTDDPNPPSSLWLQRVT